MMRIPKSHPRCLSLEHRHMLVDGFRKGFVAEAGLIAHGRGEAFDYLLGEKTLPQAREAEKAATAMLLLAENPVVSVNGNAAALVPKEIVKLSRILNAKLEVNLFYWTRKREKLIKEVLFDAGAKQVWGCERMKKKIPRLESMRRMVSEDGIWASDAVFVLLEDGDRTGALVGLGKKVVALDLNPLSRTSQNATVAVVDNIVRAVPNMIKFAGKLKSKNKKSLHDIVNSFNNRRSLQEIVEVMRGNV